jgi:hypothetical protein
MMTGRLRLKIPLKKGDAEYLKRIVEELSSLSGIEQVTMNPHTSGVLLLHNLEKNKIMEHLHASGLFHLVPLKASQAGVHGGVKNVFGEIGNKVEQVTGGSLDVSEIAFLALLGAGIFQIGKGNLTAIPWYTAFWYALNIFLKSDTSKDSSIVL